MNCAERLVSIFGSQAEVARRLRLDRAVVNNWVKSGYVPARWAMEVEQATEGKVAAVEVLNEANAKKPVKVKSRPDDLFGSHLPGSDAMSDFAPVKRIHSFHPPQRTLMGPGPSEINPRVMAAMSLPAIGYLDPVFVEMMEELKSLLRYAYQTKNALTFPVSGPGSVGMEYCFVNLVAPGDKVIVCRNGVFGGRMIENVERAGGTPIIVEDAWGEAIDPHKLEDALKKNPDARLVAFVHAETSTGVQSDAKALVEVAHKHNALAIVDAVTSLGGTPVLTDEWKVDAIYSASQKCLSCTPGLSPVSFSDARGRTRQGAQGQDPFLVHGHEPAARLLGRDHPHLPSHRAHQQPVRAARGAADPEGRGHRERVGAAYAPSPRAQSRPRSDGAEVPGEGRGAAAADERGASFPRRSRRAKPRCARPCSPNSTSRSAPDSARLPARSGASA